MMPGEAELDSRLLQIFAQSAADLDNEHFLRQLTIELKTRRRTRRWIRGAVGAALLALLLWFTPLVTAVTLTVSGWISTALVWPWIWALLLPLGLWHFQRSRAHV
jgi:hypothetical protein